MFVLAPVVPVEQFVEVSAFFELQASGGRGLFDVLVEDLEGFAEMPAAAVAAPPRIRDRTATNESAAIRRPWTMGPGGPMPRLWR